MVSIARKNLFHEKTRLAISVSGVAFAVMLVIFLLGIYGGVEKQITAYIDNSGADVFVAREGTTEMFHSFSVLPLEMESQLRAVDGVVVVSPILARQVEVHSIEGHPRIYLIGFNQTSGLGSPWKFVQGSSLLKAREILLDRVFAMKNGLGISDAIKLQDIDFTIVGITDETSNMVMQFGFVTIEDASNFLMPPSTVNFYLVRINPSYDAKAVALRIESELRGVDAFSKEEFADNNGKLVRGTFLPILLVVVIIGFVVGAMVVGLTIYTATIEKMKEYGILKAIGATNGRMYSIIMNQGLTISLLGYATSLVLFLATAYLVAIFVPEVTFALSFETFTWILAVATSLSLLASYIPMRRVGRIDPATIFRR